MKGSQQAGNRDFFVFIGYGGSKVTTIYKLHYVDTRGDGGKPLLVRSRHLGTLKVSLPLESEFLLSGEHTQFSYLVESIDGPQTDMRAKAGLATYFPLGLKIGASAYYGAKLDDTSTDKAAKALYVYDKSFFGGELYADFRPWDFFFLRVNHTQEQAEFDNVQPSNSVEATKKIDYNFISEFTVSANVNLLF
jgi:hypothetical protein